MDTLVKISLLIAVAVVFPVMVGLGIEAFYPGPEIDYSECRALEPEPKLAESVRDEASREAEIERKEQSYKEAEECRERLEEPMKAHDSVVFLITSVIGLGAIAVGALKFSALTGPAGPGLVLGGMATIMYGAGRSFRLVDKRWMFGVALLTLVGIVWVSRRWFRGSGGESK